MSKSLPPPPPRPPSPSRAAAPATTMHYSRSRFRSGKESSLGSTKTTGLPPKDKRTRNLPNFSDCHGCGVHINCTNPKEKLQLLQSFWRIILLCGDCRKMVNSGKLCSYCFKDTLGLVSDCVRCSDCEHLIHQKCIANHSHSAPWSYSSFKESSGLGFYRCVDCWVPNLFKNSVKVCGKNGISDKCGELCAAHDDTAASIKGKNDVKSLEELVSNSNTMVENKTAVAFKLKKKASKKVVVAKNGAPLASNALGLVPKEYRTKMKDEVLVGSLNDDINVDEMTTFVDDAEFAIQLHRAMNSSPRISKNSYPTNLSCPDLLKLTSSDGASPMANDLGSQEDGKDVVCSDAVTKDKHNRNILEASACIRINECLSAITPLGLKPQLKTYKRINKKRKGFQENENGDIGPPFDVAGKCTVGDDGKVVTELHPCPSDEHKQVSQVNESRTSSPESCNTNIFKENWRINRRPEHYSIKYRRITGSRKSSYNVVYRRRKGANLDGLSLESKSHASSARLHMSSSKEWGTFSDSSWQSCVVNLQACTSVGVSTQGG